MAEGLHPSGALALERAVASDRRLVLASLLAIVVPCWAWIVAMGLDMYGRMDGASAWSMTLQWNWMHTAVLLAMWIAMMAGMMLPTVAPVLLLYARVLRGSGGDSSPAGRVYALAAGYLAVWALFSVAATILQRVLAARAIVTPMMEVDSRAIGGTVLLLAGVYQLTPLKSRCLHVCRSAAGVVTSYWRRGTGGAFRMGLEHGAYCLGCCWALMLLLFAGGIMNLAVIGAITTFVLVEKLMPGGQWLARAAGVALVAAGAWVIAT